MRAEDFDCVIQVDYRLCARGRFNALNPFLAKRAMEPHLRLEKDPRERRVFEFHSNFKRLQNRLNEILPIEVFRG